MALFRLQINPISRSAGRSAPAAAAYRAGERIRDERTGLLHNYTRRRDVMHSEIFLPSAIGRDGANWARERARLWNAAEAAEHRRDSRVAREYMVCLPAELAAGQRIELARSFARELAERYSVAVDLAVHEPRAAGDPRNYHAHLLTTTREVGPTGLGAKTGLDMGYPERLKRGLSAGLKELVAIREHWATLVNTAFRSAGMSIRVDHRSLAAQGVDREPLHIPFVAYQMERRGLRTEVAERIREHYRTRVAARAAQESAREAPENRSLAPVPLSGGVPGVEELRQRSRDAWLQLRREALDTEQRQPGATEALQSEHTKSREQAATSERLRTEAADKDISL
ncbi:MAG TPA: MobQ family relaxase [Steroidobacteraceae bacterium]